MAAVAGLWNSKHFPLYSHTMLIVGPEHARTFADDDWSRDDLAREFFGHEPPLRADAARGRRPRA